MAADPISIESLVPHRGAMLLISEIIARDAQNASTRAVVSKHWPLTDDQGADALVLIELVAQTAAVNNGYELHRREGPEADNRGWIVGIKSATLHVDRLPFGTTVRLASSNRFEYENFREISGTATIDGVVAAEVTLQLMQAEHNPNVA
ncbi:MAG: hypothetical protein KJP07_14985 [Desulfatitalea sp.]|nr:hypothetical protein [Desulfatitalea sp.]